VPESSPYDCLDLGGAYGRKCSILKPQVTRVAMTGLLLNAPEGSPRRAGGFPGNGSALQSMSGHPVFGLTGHGNERLQVIQTK
jgi:hypothetical protein